MASSATPPLNACRYSPTALNQQTEQKRDGGVAVTAKAIGNTPKGFAIHGESTEDSKPDLRKRLAERILNGSFDLGTLLKVENVLDEKCVEPANQMFESREKTFQDNSRQTEDSRVSKVTFNLEDLEENQPITPEVSQSHADGINATALPPTEDHQEARIETSEKYSESLHNKFMQKISGSLILQLATLLRIEIATLLKSRAIDHKELVDLYISMITMYSVATLSVFSATGETLWKHYCSPQDRPRPSRGAVLTGLILDIAYLLPLAASVFISEGDSQTASYLLMTLASMIGITSITSFIQDVHKKKSKTKTNPSTPGQARIASTGKNSMDTSVLTSSNSIMITPL